MQTAKPLKRTINILKARGVTTAGELLAMQKKTGLKITVKNELAKMEL